MPSMCFCLINQSTKDPGYGPVTAPVLEQMATSLANWLNQDFAPVWGGDYEARYAADGIAQSGEAPVYLVDDNTAVPNAAAYHDRQADGTPIIYAMLDEFDSWLGDSSSKMPVSVGVGHELAETAGDPGANRWADRADGTEEAFETCDRVQGTDYADADSVMVPNFLYTAAFDPGASGPYDKQGALTSVTGCTPGGYVILRQPGAYIDAAIVAVPTSGVRLVGSLTGRAFENKKHHSSRASRRGCRYAA